jgi:glycine dehydrogenase
MITYPSTHGVFEEAVKDICAIMHANGGQVYMDGANLNAQVGLTSPGLIGADVSHMNLHKTFAIPHGGGGPGMGPIGLKAHLAPFMANHVVQPIDGPNKGQGAVSAGTVGVGLDPADFMDVRRHARRQGVKRATEVAILNANYVAKADASLPGALHRQERPRCARVHPRHPPDQGRHRHRRDRHRQAPDGLRIPRADGQSFPVAGTIMVEPTESESKAELDRFIAAMIAIREEIRKIEQGRLAGRQQPAEERPAYPGRHHGPNGSARTAARKPYSRCHGWRPTSSGRASIASTMCMATATCSAPAPPMSAYED